MGRQERCNVLEDNKRGATLSNELSKVVEESGLTSSESASRSHSRETDVLTWESTRPDRRFGDVTGTHLSDVCGPFNIRPMLVQDALAEGLDFTLPGCFHAGALETEIKAADAREEAREREPLRVHVRPLVNENRGGARHYSPPLKLLLTPNLMRLGPSTIVHNCRHSDAIVSTYEQLFDDTPGQ